MSPDELKERTRQFELRSIRLVRALPKAREADGVARRLARSAPAVGAAYRSACRARSRKECAARLAVGEEEADESEYWLSIIMDADMLPRDKVADLHQEALELTKIINAAVRTARRKAAEAA